MADLSGRITVTNSAATPLAQSSTWTHAKVTVVNESAVDVFIWCPGDGTTPTPQSVCNNGSAIRVGGQRELFDPSEGEDLSQWFLACKPLTGPALVSYTG